MNLYYKKVKGSIHFNDAFEVHVIAIKNNSVLLGFKGDGGRLRSNPQIASKRHTKNDRSFMNIEMPYHE